jgi:hypothetical protein
MMESQSIFACFYKYPHPFLGFFHLPEYHCYTQITSSQRQRLEESPEDLKKIKTSRKVEAINVWSCQKFFSPFKRNKAFA